MKGDADAGDPAVHGLDAYIVGGAVRDALLRLPSGDRDWVVVGATPEQMAQRGFIPVGGDFPVFLHPVTKEEYALARTERKSGRGYKGFTFYTGADVTLEEDLKRRDLTVNAIAQARDGRLIDPLGGAADIEAKILRHVGAAFSEDPVRLLRLARFAARFGDFSIAPETMALARRLVADGEVDALVPERVWREMVKGLMTSRPQRMFEVLEEAQALERVLPGLVFNDGVAAGLSCAVRSALPLASRFALLCRQSGDPSAVAKHLRAPVECQDYARLLPEVLAGLAGMEPEPKSGAGAERRSGQGSGQGSEQGSEPDSTPAPAAPADKGAGGSAGLARQLDLIERCDALRKPRRFLDLLEAACCVVPVDLPAWQARVEAVRAIDAGAIASTAQGDPARIKAALRQARLAALAAGHNG